jgi:branched-chain amino acid transport system substrate-binding protein
MTSRIVHRGLLPAHAPRGRKVGPTVAVAAVVLSLGAACSSNASTSTGASGGSASASSSTVLAVLGTPNKATDTPLKIGYIWDGQTQAADATPQRDAVKASAEYADGYLGGINGHPIDLDVCDDMDTPTGATGCAVQLVRDKVAAVLAPVTGQDVNILKVLAGTGIAYFTNVSASQDVLLSPDAFVLDDPLASIGGMVNLAKSEGVSRSAIILIDVPAASGLAGIAGPIFQQAGIHLDVVKVSPTVADMSPQVQEALSQGDKQFEVAGTPDFDAKGIKALKEAGFAGDIIVSGWSVDPGLASSIPGGLAGVTNLTYSTPATDDQDARLFSAIIDTYTQSTAKDATARDGFVGMLAFVRALTGATSAVDAPSITAALSAMPKPIPLPLGGGLTFQCGAKLEAILHAVCSNQILAGKLDAKGNGVGDYKVVDVTTSL